ncbi:MAG: FliH/SctL family protein [Dehalococcoidia bacterium]
MSESLLDGTSGRLFRSAPGGMRRSLLRPVRLGRPVTLGLDGRLCEPDDPLSGLVGGSAEETAEAGNLVELAQRRADELVNTALVEAASIHEAAQVAGYESGYREGAAVARAALAEALALVQQAAAEGAQIRNDLLRRSEREMVEMVIAAIGAVIGERSQTDRDLASQTVRHALARAGAQNVVRVRVHPSDADAVSASLGEASNDPLPFEVLPDEAVGVGGCIVDTAHGRVDARLDVQLDAIARLLRDALPPEPETHPETQGEAADAA